MNNYGVFTEQVNTMDEAKDKVFVHWTDDVAHSYSCLNDNVFALLAEIWHYNCSAEESYNRVNQAYQENTVMEQINSISYEINLV